MYKLNSSSKQIAQVDKTGIKPAKRKKKTEKKHNTHQLKIGTILQKTLVSFLYKAVVENGFSIISIANYHFKSVVFLGMVF